MRTKKIQGFKVDRRVSITTARIAAASNLRVDGVTATSAIFIVDGDDTGGDAVWSAVPRTSGNSFSATTPNAYTATALADDLSPGITYDLSVSVNGGGALTAVFTTDSIPVQVETGITPVRRRSM